LTIRLEPDTTFYQNRSPGRRRGLTRRVVGLARPQFRHPGVTHAAKVGRLRAPVPERRGGEHAPDDTKTHHD